MTITEDFFFYRFPLRRSAEAVYPPTASNGIVAAVILSAVLFASVVQRGADPASRHRLRFAVHSLPACHFRFRLSLRISAQFCRRLQYSGERPRRFCVVSPAICQRTASSSRTLHTGVRW